MALPDRPGVFIHEGYNCTPVYVPTAQNIPMTAEDDTSVKDKIDSLRLESLQNVAVDPVTLTNHQALVYSSTQHKWVNSGAEAVSLGALSDTDITNPQNGDTLKYDSDTGVWENAAGPTTLAGLTDVRISSPADYQVLAYNANAQVWSNLSYAPWVELTAVLPVYGSTVTFQHPSITTDSTIDYYTSVFGVNPGAIVVDTGILTLTFAPVDTVVYVKVRIS